MIARRRIIDITEQIAGGLPAAFSAMRTAAGRLILGPSDASMSPGQPIGGCGWPYGRPGGSAGGN
jgi:hypothetical protein